MMNGIGSVSQTGSIVAPNPMQEMLMPMLIGAALAMLLSMDLTALILLALAVGMWYLFVMQVKQMWVD